MENKHKISGSVTLADTFHFLGIIGLFTLFCWYAKTVATTLIISVLFVFILDPAVIWLESFRVRRWLAILIVILITLSIISSIMYFAIIRAQEFVKDLPQYQSRIESVIKDIENRMRKLEKATQEIIPQTPGEVPISEVKIQQKNKWQEALIYFAEIIIHTALIPFLVFFILLNRDKLRNRIALLFGEANRAVTENALNQIQSQMIGFFSGNFVAVIILAFITYPGFLLAGVDYALLNTIFFSILNIIPVIGVVVGLIPAVLLTILETDSWFRILWIIGFGLMMHLIYANIFIPKMVGARVKLSPVAVIIAMLYWGWIWGATGFILAIPLMAILKTICDHVEPWRPIGNLLG